MTQGPTLATERVSLVKDERGAMLVIGIFMAIFLTAMLGYVAALGQALWYRERLQDAADGTAISSAILLARSMNLVVLLNLIMEALVMVVLILQILVTVIGIVALILAACFLYPAATAMLALGYEVYDISSQVKDIVVGDIIPILHDLEGLVRLVAPTLAELDAISNSREDYGDVVDFGFLVPSRLTLPIEQGVYADICGKAAKDLFQAITDVLHVPKIIGEAISGAMSAIVEPLTFWFCGGDFDAKGLVKAGKSGESGFKNGDKPPTTERKYNEDYPSYPGKEACLTAMQTLQIPCKDAVGNGAAQANCIEHEDPCGDYDTKGLQPAKPSVERGCRGARDEASCSSHAATARTDCNAKTTPQRGDFMYSTGEIHETWVYTKGEWVESRKDRKVIYKELKGQRPEMTKTPGDLKNNFDAAEFSEDPRTRNKEGNPCQGYWDARRNLENNGRGYEGYVEGTEPEKDWNTKRYASAEDEGKPDLILPVCTGPVQALPDPTEFHKEGEIFPRNYSGVLDVYLCAEEKSQTVEIVNFDKGKSSVGGFSKEANGGDSGGEEEQQSEESNDDDKSPYLVDKKLFLGDDDFKVRSVIYGSALTTKNSAMLVARWGKDEQKAEPILKLLSNISRFSVAQAEFFYEPPNHKDAGVRDDWMWNMYWKGRLAHFTLPFIGGDSDDSGGGGLGMRGGSKSGADGKSRLRGAFASASGTSANDTALSEVFYAGGVQSTVNNAVTGAQNSANNTVKGAQTTVNNAVTGAQNKVNTTVTNAQNAANGVVQDAQGKANSIVTNAQTKVNSTVTNAQNKLNTTVTNAQGQGEAAVSKAQGAVDKIVQQAQSVVNNIVTEAQGKLTNTITQAQTKLNSIVQQTQSTVNNTVNGAVGTANNALNNGVNQANNAVNNGVNQANNAVNNGINQANNAVNNGVSQANNAVNNGLNQANNAVNNGLGTANNALNNGLNSANDTLNGALGTANDTLNGALGTANNALNNGLNQANNAVNNGVGTANDAVNGALGTANDAINTGLGTANDALNSGLGTANDALNSALGSANDALSGALGSANDALSSGLGGMNDLIDQGVTAGSDALSGGLDSMTGSYGGGFGAGGGNGLAGSKKSGGNIVDKCKKPGFACAKAFAEYPPDPASFDLIGSVIKDKMTAFFQDGAIGLCDAAMEKLGAKDVPSCKEIIDMAEMLAEMVGH